MKLSSIEKLHSTLSTLTQKSMPLRLAYKFTKLASQIEEDYSFFIDKTREIIFKYAQIDENGNIKHNDQGNIIIKPDCISQTNQELQELEEIDIDSPNITFTLDELENLDISPADLQPLLPFIEE